MLKLDTRPGIIFSGIVAIGFTIAYIALMDDYFYRNGMHELGKHISCVEILSSVVLIVGVLKQNYKLFVPWMISSGLFIYLMLYVTMEVLNSSYNWIFVPTLMVPSMVYLSCALYSVKKAFDAMREDQSESRTSVPEKKNILNFI